MTTTAHNGSNAKTATIEVLTAEVRVLMVGSRQITLSVYRQLDRIDHEEVEPFGRVSDVQDEKWAREQEMGRAVFVVGRHAGTGALVRSEREWPQPRAVRVDGLTTGYARDRGIKVDGQAAIILDRTPAHCDGTAVWMGEGKDWGCTRLGSEGKVHEGRGCMNWHFTSPEAEAEAARRVRAMRAVLEERQQAYNDWVDLPPIVLAGLR